MSGSPSLYRCSGVDCLEFDGTTTLAGEADGLPQASELEGRFRTGVAREIPVEGEMNVDPHQERTARMETIGPHCAGTEVRLFQPGQLDSI